jgi:hypothetical protein
MASTGRITLQSAASVNPGDSPGYSLWYNPANALDSDANVATTTLYDTDISHRLNLTNQANVANLLPVGATVTGLKCYATARQVDQYGPTNVQQLQARPIKGGAVSGTLLGTAMLSSTFGEVSIGGDGMLGGQSFTRDEAIAATTGISLRTYRNVGDEATDKYSEIRFAEIEWFYTAPPLPPAIARRKTRPGHRVGV